VPIVCLVRPRGLERVEQGVLVVSIDRLIPVLRAASACSVGRPTSLARADASAQGHMATERFA
jgi:hypothetical protein